MEVVMGRCFPLTGPGHQQSLDFPVVKGVVYKGEGATATQVSRGVNGIANHAAVRETREASPPSEVPPNKVVAPHHNIVPQNSKQPAASARDERPSCIKKDRNSSQTHEATQKTKEINSNGKPKVQSILRRATFRGTEEPQEKHADENSTNAQNKPDGTMHQDSAGEREQSGGKRAWEVTQRRKAQMKEEFFKVPYEECNREAARSLGGRLNKSEPRLNTVGKERKKRNSLTYKRRVHFDLDYNEDEENNRSKYRSRSFEAADPPKKVVVSIYSIDDTPRRVIQPESMQNFDVPAESSQSNTRTKSARPTDLDSLQQKILRDNTEKQQKPDNTKEPSDRTDSNLFARKPQHVTPTTATITTTEHTSGAKSVVTMTDNSVARQDESPSSTIKNSHTSSSLPGELSVRPRYHPLVSPQGVSGKPVASWSTNLASKTASLSLDQSRFAPVPAPRSHLTKSKSLPGYSQPQSKLVSQEVTSVTSQQPIPRPDHLNLTSSPSRTSTHAFRPTKILVHPQTISPKHTASISPSTLAAASQGNATTMTPTSLQTSIVPCVSTSSHSPFALHTPATLNKPSSSCTPMGSHTTASHIPTTPVTPTTPPSPTNVPASPNAPIPKPRKRISVSQQTVTPQSSPHHSAHISGLTKQPSHPSTLQTSHHNNKEIHSNLESSLNSQESITIPAYSSNISTKSNSVDVSRGSTHSTVLPDKRNRENGSSRYRKKTDINERENSVNILMTKGDSYSKHNIVISSHSNSSTPTVTVRKVFIPSSAPPRSSPSPTPSCASSSCSFGSSGSSSGCFSGSPSPTPTPSPTRIRASCVPTDL